VLLDDYTVKLSQWQWLRNRLETSINPYQEVINYYNAQKKCKL